MIESESIRSRFEDGVNCVDEFGSRTVIVRKLDAFQIVGFSGFEICEYIGSAKFVDGLFGIADEKQVFGAIPKELVYDSVLNGVGILEFVYERGVVAFANRLYNRVAVFVV